MQIGNRLARTHTHTHTRLHHILIRNSFTFLLCLVGILSIARASHSPRTHTLHILLFFTASSVNKRHVNYMVCARRTELLRISSSLTWIAASIQFKHSKCGAFTLKHASSRPYAALNWYCSGRAVMIIICGSICLLFQPHIRLARFGTGEVQPFPFNRPFIISTLCETATYTPYDGRVRMRADDAEIDTREIIQNFSSCDANYVCAAV